MDVCRGRRKRRYRRRQFIPGRCCTIVCICVKQTYGQVRGLPRTCMSLPKACMPQRSRPPGHNRSGFDGLNHALSFTQHRCQAGVVVILDPNIFNRELDFEVFETIFLCHLLVILSLGIQRISSAAFDHSLFILDGAWHLWTCGRERE
jgi:hypothetical protein